jgi:hypothetical protein
MKLTPVFVFIMLLGCAEKQLDKPKNLLSKEEMVDILFDISALNAIDGTYPNVLDRNDLSVMEYVYQKYSIDSVQFASSDLYYASIPVTYEAIYQALEERMGQKRDSINEALKSSNEAEREKLKEKQSKGKKK